MENKRREIIKKYIYENIKLLEDTKAAREDKKIARMLINEEVQTLIKELFQMMTIDDTSKEVLAFRRDMNEIAEMLSSYLAKLDIKYNKFDEDINEVYRNILFII